VAFISAGHLEKTLKTIESNKIRLNRYRFRPTGYPGHRPRYSFLFTSRGLLRLKLGSLDYFLKSNNLSPLKDRIAVLAYGSNACPGQLLNKCIEQPRLDNLPVLYGKLHGAAAVYCHRLSGNGYVPATLASSKTEQSTWITLLTSEQLHAMDISEGRPTYYQFARILDVDFTIGSREISPIYSYVNIRGGVMLLNGKPVKIRNVGQKEAKTLLRQASPGEASALLKFQALPLSVSPTPMEIRAR
jgi:hypothetical protein